jgi:two-component system nitrate/nitrite sensor histidine kinase NarX
VGTLNLYYAKPRVSSQDELDLAVSFCDQTAPAIKNARLARELHDSVAQTIFSASLIVDVLPTIWEQNPVEARGALNDLRKLTHGALAEMRTLLLELRPVELGDVGLADLLKQLAEGVSGHIRTQVKVRVEGEAILPTEIKLAFYRIAQEALNNAAKHSSADKVDIELRSLPVSASRRKGRGKGTPANPRIFSEFVSLSIRDNGRGFDPKSVMSEHLGLGIMQECAANLQIALSIQSKPHKGTEVLLQWTNPGK